MKKPVITNDKIRQLKCFREVANVIGDNRAIIELGKALMCDCSFGDTYSIHAAFCWEETHQGVLFWRKIHDGVNPYEN